MHALQALHEVAKQNARNMEEIRVRNTALWIEQFKLRFVHIRRYDAWDIEDDLRIANTGGLTVAYTLPERKGGQVIRVSVALVHENDVFCKRTGRYHAAKNYYNDKTVQLRVPRNTTPATFLKEAFASMA